MTRPASGRARRRRAHGDGAPPDRPARRERARHADHPGRGPALLRRTPRSWPVIGGNPVDFLLPGRDRPRDRRERPGQPRNRDGLRAFVRRPQAPRWRAPHPRWGLVAAKLAAVLLLEVVQVVVLLVVAALALGWRPGAGWSPILLVLALVLGTLAFAGPRPAARRHAPRGGDAGARQRPLPRRS